MRRIEADYPRLSVAPVNIRGYFCSNLACFDLVIFCEFFIQIADAGRRIGMAGKRAQRGEKDSDWRDGYFFCNFIFCFLCYSNAI
jgi:hypothetical protein